jgi:hypothetical protein
LLIHDFGMYDVVNLDSRVARLAIRSFARHVMNTVTFPVPSRLRVIEREAFLACKFLVSITIPSTVEVIGEGAFQECLSLHEVRIASGSQLQLIQHQAFDNRYLDHVDVPSTVTIRQDFEVMAELFDEDGSKGNRVRFIAPPHSRPR